MIEPEFLHFLSDFDIVCLVETWLSEEEKFKIDGYSTLMKNRKKRGKRGRMAGGIAIFVKEGRGLDFEIINNCVEEVLWVKIKTKNLNFILGVIYKHPMGSVYWERGTLNDIEEEVNELRGNGGRENVILLGDFNCRIGELNVEVGEEDNFYNIFGNRSYRNRTSKDKIINNEGKEMIRGSVKDRVLKF